MIAFMQENPEARLQLMRMINGSGWALITEAGRALEKKGLIHRRDAGTIAQYHQLNLRQDYSDLQKASAYATVSPEDREVLDRNMDTAINVDDVEGVLAHTRGELRFAFRTHAAVMAISDGSRHWEPAIATNYAIVAENAIKIPEHSITTFYYPFGKDTERFSNLDTLLRKHGIEETKVYHPGTIVP